MTIPSNIGYRRTLIFLAVCALGVSSIVTQLTLMRELLSVFSGNEMVFGVILGNWLLLTGIGSYLGKGAPRLKDPVVALILAEILIAILPVAYVFLVRVLRNVIFVRGAVVGVAETVVSCLVLLAPYCLIAGYLLTLACCVLASKDEPRSIGQVYFMDNIGDIAGGLLFSFVLIYFFNHFGILYVPAFLNLLFAGVLAFLLRKRVLLGTVVLITAAFAALAATIDLDMVSTDIEYSGQNVVFRGSSPYGDLVVTQHSGQYNFIESGVPLFSTNNIAEVEESVHYAMAQRPDAKTVLLISGGVSGTAQEITSRYSVSRLDYVELDPLIIEVGRRYIPESLADPRIRVFNTDGRLFVKEASRRYDVVIADLPDPSTFQLNRFYTVQFFQEAKGSLEQQGVLAISLGQYENYLSKELARLIAVTHHTLKQVFCNVLIIPGGRILFLASDGPLHEDIATRLEDAGIHTQLVHRYYLEGTLTSDRLADMRRAVSGEAAVNRDFTPVLYYHQLRYWVSQFKVKFGVFAGVIVLLLSLYLIRMRAVPFSIFTTGFAASSLEVVLLIGFQILYGYVYHRVGLIVTAFMLGLAAGSFTMNRMLPKRTMKDLVRLEFGIGIYAACVPFVLIGLGKMGTGTLSSISMHVGVPILTFFLAAFAGMEFPLAGKADFRGIAPTAARLYTADFVGACLGALLVSTFLIPLIGVIWVCLLVAGLNILSGTIVRVRGTA